MLFIPNAHQLSRKQATWVSLIGAVHSMCSNKLPLPACFAKERLWRYYQETGILLYFISVPCQFRANCIFDPCLTNGKDTYASIVDSVSLRVELAG